MERLTFHTRAAAGGPLLVRVLDGLWPRPSGLTRKTGGCETAARRVGQGG